MKLTPHHSTITEVRLRGQHTRSLTPREMAIVELVYLDNADIGLLLGLSTKTVKTYMGRIMMKLGVENRTAAYALHMRKDAQRAESEIGAERKRA